MAIKGKQLADAPNGLDTSKYNDGSVTAVKVANDVTVADGSHPFTGDQSHGGHKITNLADPTAAQDGATKAYVDALVNGAKVKAPALAVATANVAIAGLANVIDGVAINAANMRVLLTNQTNPIENGPWLSNAAAWTRPADFANGSSAAGSLLVVEEGTVNADTQWICTTDPPNDVVGTNSLTFVKFANPFTYTFRNGLAATGSTVDVVPGNGSLTATPGSLVVAQAAPASNGTANALGAADTSSKSDHVHNTPISSPGNRNMAGAVTAADGDAATASTVAKANFGTGAPSLYVNGVGPYNMGDGTKVGVDCYISGDGGATARAFGAIVAGDTIRWNGSIAGFQIAASDKLTLVFQAFT